MGELFCPIHGIPALIVAFLGADANILTLTFLLYRDRLIQLVQSWWQVAALKAKLQKAKDAFAVLSDL
jgi:hypothetical protein